jgi:hypothetical protein
VHRVYENLSVCVVYPPNLKIVKICSLIYCGCDLVTAGPRGINQRAAASMATSDGLGFICAADRGPQILQQG